MDKLSEKKISFFQTRLLQFWETEGRHSLPWRSTRDPWKLILAEVLLRKTTTYQAEKMYDELQNFGPHDIIKVRLSVLESKLKPIGMNKIRAEQLKSIALAFTGATDEQIKSNDFLKSLPGIGKYISNMVRCCAFDLPLPGLDTNMIRILQRFFDYHSDKSRAREDKNLWAFAQELVPKSSPKKFNWAVIDFGACVCKKKNPSCGGCHLSSMCIYFKNVYSKE